MFIWRHTSCASFLRGNQLIPCRKYRYKRNMNHTDLCVWFRIYQIIYIYLYEEKGIINKINNQWPSYDDNDHCSSELVMKPMSCNIEKHDPQSAICIGFGQSKTLVCYRTTFKLHKQRMWHLCEHKRWNVSQYKVLARYTIPRDLFSAVAWEVFFSAFTLLHVYYRNIYTRYIQT